MKQILLALVAVSVIGLVVVFMYYDRHYEKPTPVVPEPTLPEVVEEVPPVTVTEQSPITMIGYLECLPIKPGIGETTLECAIGIAIDQSDGHVALDARLLGNTPLDIPMGSKVSATGMFAPVGEESPLQKYDIDGILRVSTITPVTE